MTDPRALDEAVRRFPATIKFIGSALRMNRGLREFLLGNENELFHRVWEIRDEYRRILAERAKGGVSQ